MELKDAMNLVIKEIKNDPEYRATWVANLTMATYDELDNALPHWNFNLKKDIADRAAERFLEWLCAGYDQEQSK